MYKTPILFVIFCRKDIALKTLAAIRKAKPSKMYIACDGARQHVEGEAAIVEATRQAVLKAIDWDCEVHTLFQKENLGCGPGVFTAINWLFENEEQGIILEDDCIADETFFPYVAELLDRYRTDDRIGMIAGSNQISAGYPMPYSYCFSKYAACWGWATWRRAWKNMDIGMNFLKDHYNDILVNRGYLGREKGRWTYQLQMIHRNRVSAWDWQWYFSLASQNQLCIFPQHNLISNIGNDAQATHTSYATIYMQSHSLDFPLRHPQYVLPDSEFDYRFHKADNTWAAIIKRNMPYSLKNFIKHHIH